MRLLLDANLSPHLIHLLGEAGHDTVHVADIRLLTASDSDILQQAETDQRVLVTADTDFPEMLALGGTSRPSVVLLRGVSELPLEDHAALLISNLSQLTAVLETGAIATHHTNSSPGSRSPNPVTTPPAESTKSPHENEKRPSTR